MRDEFWTTIALLVLLFVVLGTNLTVFNDASCHTDTECQLRFGGDGGPSTK